MHPKIATQMAWIFQAGRGGGGGVRPPLLHD
jgi:hypothetical protein